MVFFSPLTEDDLRRARIPLASGAHTSPTWADEELWKLELLHGCRHDHNAGIATVPSVIAQNDLVSIDLEKIGVSPVAMLLRLSLRVFASPDGADGIRGVWPWVVSTSLGSEREDVFYLAGRPGDICRFGVRYSNGARVETGTGFRDNWYVWGEEDTGSYCAADLRLQFKGHSEGPKDSSADLLLFPAPSPGAVELFTHWPGVNLPETSFAMAQSLIESASGCSMPTTAEYEAEVRQNLTRLAP